MGNGYDLDVLRYDQPDKTPKGALPPRPCPDKPRRNTSLYLVLPESGLDDLPSGGDKVLVASPESALIRAESAVAAVELAESEWWHADNVEKGYRVVNLDTNTVSMIRVQRKLVEQDDGN